MKGLKEREEEKREAQLLKELESYDQELQRQFVDYSDKFYEAFAKVIAAGDIVDHSLRFPSEDEPNGSVHLVLDIKRAEYLMRLSYAKFMVNDREFSAESIRETQELILRKNQPFGFVRDLWMKPTDEKIRKNIRKSEAYYRKLIGYNMPKRPESVGDYLKGLIDLHFERRKK
jgi:hypothetical protein